jgi:hypothetical protein
MIEGKTSSQIKECLIVWGDTGGVSEENSGFNYLFTELCLTMYGFASGLINLTAGNRVALSAGMQYNLSSVYCVNIYCVNIYCVNITPVIS